MKEITSEGNRPPVGSWEHLEGYRTPSRQREVGTVVSVHGDNAQVLLRRSRRCEGCGSCCVAAGEGSMLAEALNRVGAKEGDRVEVELPLKASLKAAYILYGIPLLAFLIGIGVGSLVGLVLFGGGFNVPLGLIFGFGFLAISYLLLARVFAPRARASSPYRLVITRVLD